MSVCLQSVELVFPLVDLSTELVWCVLFRRSAPPHLFGFSSLARLIIDRSFSASQVANAVLAILAGQKRPGTASAFAVCPIEDHQSRSLSAINPLNPSSNGALSKDHRPLVEAVAEDARLLKAPANSGRLRQPSLAKEPRQASPWVVLRRDLQADNQRTL